jgi:hypothetical protein
MSLIRPANNCGGTAKLCGRVPVVIVEERGD